jgi:low affinity Fe/Cu permease
MSMADQEIQAHLITKPIQLLAAWLIGLVLTDGTLLTAARFITTPAWVPGLLTIAAVVCVPVFLLSIFLLQTKFRPEMQEDTFYSTYLQQQRQEMADQKKADASLEAEVRELRSKLIEIDSERSEQGSEIAETTARAAEREELVRRISQLETKLEQVRDVQSTVRATESSLSRVGRFREINLVDSNNKTRALFTTLIDDEPSLMFFGKEGYEPGREASHTILLDSANDGDVSLRRAVGD